jgi:pimeloyl-ACP methyl ester carboxylesterase/DNA-binding CsgD family transcriptional regulator
MEQQIRFLVLPGGPRIAYAVFGRGPALVATPPGSDHLEIVWQFPSRRALWEGLAEHHTVVVYDRWGTGLSDRDRDDFTLAADLAVLEGLVDQLKLRHFALFGASGGGPAATAYAARHPRRLSHLILYGTTVGPLPPDPTWAPLQALMRADWPLASRTLAELWFREATPVDIALMGRLFCEAATAETMIAFREAREVVDLRDVLPGIVTPTLVLQRQGDTFAPAEAVRQLAAAIPGARYVAVEGRSHFHFLGDVQPLLRVMLDFLGTVPRRAAPAPHGATTGDGTTALDRLSARELEVLGLLSAGFSTKASAARLVISVHTVERHAANIYAKLGTRSRAEAVAYAYQHGLPPATSSLTT